jgi:hypothetical protein
MTGKPIAGEGLPANLAGMTKNQLYDIMFQMKVFSSPLLFRFQITHKFILINQFHYLYVL